MSALHTGNTVNKDNIKQPRLTNTALVINSVYPLRDQMQASPTRSKKQAYHHRHINHLGVVMDRLLAKKVNITYFYC